MTAVVSGFELLPRELAVRVADWFDARLGVPDPKFRDLLSRGAMRVWAHPHRDFLMVQSVAPDKEHLDPIQMGPRCLRVDLSRLEIEQLNISPLSDGVN